MKKHILMIQNRREFISMIMAGMAVPSVLGMRKTHLFSESGNFAIHLFSKPLDKYDLDFICDCCTGAGIKGIDLTVRKDGKIEPEQVEKLLPLYVDKISGHGLAADMIVTGILSADQTAERILKTAAQTGVKYYRLGWYSYDNTDVQGTLQKCHEAVRNITELNRKYNIKGSYQNHSGEFIGSAVWDLNDLFRDLPREFIGTQYDIRHAMVEGFDTWLVAMRLISKYINTLSVKDFRWSDINGKQEPTYTPLGEGIVDWDRYFKALKDLNIFAPVTLHIEYPLLEKEEEMLPLLKQQEIIVRKLKKDTDFLKSYLNKYQLI